MTGMRGLSRRTFLLGVGGGAASMSIAWGVLELGLPFGGSGDESPAAASLDALAEYDGWLVTAEDKASMVLVEFTCCTSITKEPEPTCSKPPPEHSP